MRHFKVITSCLNKLEGSTAHHPDNWKYNVIGNWLVTGKELL